MPVREVLAAGMAALALAGLSACASSGEPADASRTVPGDLEGTTVGSTPFPAFSRSVASATARPVSRTLSKPPAPVARATTAAPRPRRTTAPTPGRTTQAPNPTAPPPAGVLHVVHMADFSFTPSALTIGVGDRVRAVNDMGSHTFTGTAGPKTWDSGTVAQGDSYTVTFTSKGSYSFICSFHDSLGMKGTVTVR